MHHPTDRITHTTAFVTPVVEHWLEREIAQWETTNVSLYNVLFWGLIDHFVICLVVWRGSYLKKEIMECRGGSVQIHIIIVS